MNYLAIDLYKDFECIAGDCPNTCCAGWGIIIDEATRKKMVEKEEILGIAAEDWLEHINGSYRAKLIDCRCSMLNEDNLCNVVLKLGSEYLSITCQQYPRLLIKYGNITDLHMSMSCPEIISKLMSKDTIEFDFFNDGGDEDTYKYADLYLFESSVRTTMVEVVGALKNFSLETRLYIVYKMLERAIEFYEQDVLDDNAFLNEVAFYFQENILLSFEQQLRGIVSEKSRWHFLQELAYVFKEVSAYGKYEDILLTAIKYYETYNYEDYVQHLELFSDAFAEYEKFYTNYWITHIFMDAMEIPEYDKAKNKFIYAAANFCIIQSIALANFVQNGMKLSREDYILIISNVCRTMEHNIKFRDKLAEVLNENNAICIAGLMLMILK